MGEFANELQELIKPNKIINFSVFGFDMSITDSVIMMWIVMAFLIIFSLVFTRKLKTIPEGKQNVVEVIVEFIYNFAKDSMGHNGKLFAPYIGTVLLFLIVSNMAAIFNVIPSSEDIYHWTGIEYFKDLNFAIRPPTKDVNVTLTFDVNGCGGSGRNKGKKGVPLMLPFKMLVFGNILGAVIIMELVYFAFPAVLPAFLSIYFDLFDGILQAYVFVFLTSIYMGEAVE